MKPSASSDLRVPALLLVLSVVPVVAGVVRLAGLSGPATAANTRFVHSPLPVSVHVVSASVYCLAGAFQFSRSVRLRAPAWHRRAGRVLVGSGLLAALSGLWMAAFYPIPTELQGPLLRAVRMVVGGTMIAGIVAAWRAILRRDVRRHEAWMVRAYALGQGAGTQVLVLGPAALISSEVVGLTRDLLMTLAWVINVGVAEWIIRRRTPRAGAPRLPLSPAAPRA